MGNFYSGTVWLHGTDEKLRQVVERLEQWGVSPENLEGSLLNDFSRLPDERQPLIILGGEHEYDEDDEELYETGSYEERWFSLLSAEIKQGVLSLVIETKENATSIAEGLEGTCLLLKIDASVELRNRDMVWDPEYNHEIESAATVHREVGCTICRDIIVDRDTGAVVEDLLGVV